MRNLRELHLVIKYRLKKVHFFQSKFFLSAGAKPVPVLASAALFVLVAFQNCSSLKGFESANGAGVTSSNSLSVLSPDCRFNGQTVPEGLDVIAFLNSNGSSNQPCISEKRVCNHGLLSGSYAYASCANDQAKACLFNGQTIVSGASVTAFIASTAPVGQSCSSETRVCSDGVLSGAASYASCLPAAPKACLFDGQTIASGASVPAYLNSGAANGAQCVVQARTCSDGILSGSYSFASCAASSGDACVLGGNTIPSGSALTTFQNGSVPYGQNCVSESRACVNGQLSGSFSYTSCAVDAPKPCLFNGQTIASGATVKAYAASTVPYGQSCVSEERSCTNGTLSGSDTMASCQPDAPAACQFNGTTVPSGQKLTAYSAASVPYGSLCAGVAHDYMCNNGSFSPATPTFANCVVDSPSPCLFLGQTLASGQMTANAFSMASVPYGQSCSSVQTTVTCTNAALSTANGQPVSQYTSNSCVTQPGASCTYNGQSVADAHSVTAYSSSTVEIGHSCAEVQVSLACANGVLSPSGAQTFPTCQPKVAPPCLFNGQSIASGQSFSAFTAATVPYGSDCSSVAQSYTCNAGNFTPSTPVAAVCAVGDAPCTFNGQSLASGQSTSNAFSAATVTSGQSCSAVQTTVTCNKGTLSTASGNPVSSYTFAACSVLAAPVACPAAQGVYDGNCRTCSAGDPTQILPNHATAGIQLSLGGQYGFTCLPTACQDGYQLVATTGVPGTGECLQVTGAGACGGSGSTYHGSGLWAKSAFGGGTACIMTKCDSGYTLVNEVCTPSQLPCGANGSEIADPLRPSVYGTCVTCDSSLVPYHGTCVAPTKLPTANVNSFYNPTSGDYIYTTTDGSQLAAQGYVSKGVAFKVFTSGFPGANSSLYSTVNLTQIVKGMEAGGSHFLTWLDSNRSGCGSLPNSPLFPNGGGLTLETLGWALTTQLPGTVPVYAFETNFHYLSTAPFLYSKDVNAGPNAGLPWCIGILGYVVP